MLELDHVLLAVDDLSAAARLLEERHGLASVEGGSHPRWGTANRIVRLGATYLELIAVADEAAAAVSPFGRWVAGAAGAEPRPLGWAVRTDDLEAEARRLGLDVAAGQRTRPGGEVVRWRLAGVDEAVLEPMLPFFIEWAPGTVLPGRLRGSDPTGDAAVERLVLSGDEARLAHWLGSASLPVEVHAGASRVLQVILATPAGAIVL